MLAVAILTIVIGAAVGLIKGQIKLSSSINLRQTYFNDARVAMEFITQETATADERRIIPLGSGDYGIVSWDTYNDIEIDRLVSDTLDSSYKLYYDSSSHKLFSQTGDVVAENIISLDIGRTDPGSFALSDGSSEDIIVNNVYKIEIEAGTGDDDDDYTLKAYIRAQ